ncbi:MAG: GNAT family N-acetyltransferase [Alphaproteobacteria bacterium]|nr:GNAT family N-acetyltransferase [Alphaproteobacteria bacterium]MBL6940335.1 GNAT family N-acetyltransferase [Alphaproteobacteria bacterium]MBL7098207.1 GNAT family N-acetyltransferase [Alphaproteobacteria bacterium]
MLSGPEPLTDAHDISQFSCGKSALDQWLKTRALANHQHGFTLVMVAHEARRVVGFYGLAPTGVEPRLLSRPVRTGQPPNPVPCILLGQLATDSAWAGRGIGSALLRSAVTRSLEASKLVGGRALVVRAVDAEAADYWRRHGFMASKDDPLLFFQSFPNLAATLGDTDKRDSVR